MPIQQPANYPYNWNPNPMLTVPQPNVQPTVPQQNIQPTTIIADVNAREEAFYWAVAPGTSMIFRRRDGNAIYTKTAGYSLTEPPIFEEFIKAEAAQNEVAASPEPDYKSEIDKLWGEVNELKNRQGYKPQNNKRREDGGTGNAQ